MLYFHPTSAQHFQQRNALLQSSLRPEPLPFSIELEYPLVLAPEGRQFSYCQSHEGHVCAHLNLWPRRVLDPQGQELFRIGLVGNVATDAAVRGLGHMRSLLTAIEAEAKEAGLAAFILWSDLSTFYHKLGFTSVGKECRFTSLAAQLPPVDRLRVVHFDTSDISETTLEAMRALRLPLALTLERSSSEFRRLLSIPWLDLFLAFDGSTLVAYALLGKGFDMMGVVHEWGARDPSLMIELMAGICFSQELPQIMLLAPGSMPEDWQKAFARRASLHETVPMALVKLFDNTRAEELEQLFIWGLDSI